MESNAFRSINKNLPRIDLASKLSGRALFAEDVSVPEGLLTGRILRSPHAHARILRLDTSQAEALEGVRAVVSAKHLPERRFGPYLRDEPYFASDRVLFAGNRVAAVAADTLEIAEQALRLIEVDYEPLTALMDPFAALDPAAPLLHPELMTYHVDLAAQPAGGNLCSLNELSRGDPEAALAGAGQVFEETYTTEMVHHAYLEPHGCLARCNEDGTFTVHSSTQGTFPLRNQIAFVLGVPQNRVRVIGTEIGGGFGGKISLQDEVAAALLAREAGQPVRIIMTREEDQRCGTPRAGFHMVFKTGVAPDGKLLARTIDIVLDQGAYAHGSVLMAASLPTFAEGPYHIPNLRIRVRAVYTNKAPCSAFRAPGGPQTNFAIESEMERIAEALGLDALQFRRMNLMAEGHVTLAGVEMKSVWSEETLAAALKQSGYEAGTASLGDDRGRGLGFGNWNVGGMPSGAVIKLNDDGSATLITGVVDLTGVHTALVQVVAEVLGLPEEEVTVKCLDTEGAPTTSLSAGSQALKSTGTAAKLAAEDVRRQLMELAVPLLDVNPERMVQENGLIHVAGEPERAVTVPDLIRQAMGSSGPIVGYGGTGNLDRLPSFACQVADVAVERETGQVRVERLCAVQDAGLAINPLNCIGQVQGGVAQGVGMALSEEQRYVGGQLANAGFLDYKIPSALDLPLIETLLVEKPAVTGPFGAKGIGEPPVVPTPAAIANAIYHAVGVRMTSLPITPEKLRRALREKEAGQ